MDTDFFQMETVEVPETLLVFLDTHDLRFHDILQGIQGLGFRLSLNQFVSGPWIKLVRNYYSIFFKDVSL